MLGPILKGKKIILKPIKVSEANNFLRWFKDPEVTRYLLIDGEGLTSEKEKKTIKNFRKKKDQSVWSIYTKDKIHIGSTGLNNIDTKKHKKAVWGIVIGERSYWRQGIGTDVLKTVLRFCFNKLKLNRVELSVYAKNRGTYRLYLKCGFKKEGIRRQAIFKNGKYNDDIIMGILKSDYKKLKNK